MCLLRWSWLLLLAAVATAQPALQLKPHLAGKATRLPVAPGEERRRSNRRHLIVQFSHLPQPEELKVLTDRGYRILQYLPEFAYVVAAPDWVTLDRLALQWSGALKAGEKISPAFGLVADLDNRFALIEFYPDVDMNEARAIVLQTETLRIQENPDLLEHHLLVQGPPDAISALASWDEVGYIFPAADDLVEGVPMNACAGALTEQGQVGQSVAKVGGWGGPGLTGADLQYAFYSLTDKLPADSAKDEIVRAFSEWARYAKLTFTPSEDTKANRTLSVLFGSRSHGDQFPFDGPGGVLAHTFYPYPLNQEPLAGDMHFDADENWHIGADVDLFSVALHETGHALGLGHSDRPGAVMYPYYRRVAALTPEDIGAVQTLYAAPDGPGAVSPLSLIVQAPAGTNTGSTASLSGSASGGTGAIRVTWTTGAGGAGAATGSQAWFIPAIPLIFGANGITVTATDDAQSKATQTLQITRPPTAKPPSVPSLSITLPTAGGTYGATSPSVTLSGTAADESGIAGIAWNTSKGRVGQASGTLAWSTGPIPLDPGTTTVTVTANAVSGVAVAQSLQVVYSPVPVTPAPPPPAPIPPPAPPGNDTTPPSLVIVAPPSSYQATSTATIAFSGTAKGNRPVASVTWSTSNGDSGTAAGAESWSAAAIPLLVGSNTVTIRAKDTAGNASWRAVTVVRR